MFFPSSQPSSCMPCVKAASRCAPAASDENNITPTRRMVPAGCPRPSVYAKNRPMPPASKMLRRVFTVHLVDERTPAIVRLQRELSAGNERLLVAETGDPQPSHFDPLLPLSL